MKSFLASVVVAALLPAEASAQQSQDATSNPRLTVTAFTGVADYQPGFMLASGPYATLGAAISGRITSRLEVELSVARPITGALQGSRVNTVYPWGRSGMTAAQVLESGAVQYENSEIRDTSLEMSLLARWKLRRWNRIEPALLAGLDWQSARVTQTTQVARGTRESYRLETLTFPGRARRDPFWAGGFEAAIPVARHWSVVPQIRMDLRPYGDADPDVVFRSNVGIRWRF